MKAAWRLVSAFLLSCGLAAASTSASAADAPPMLTPGKPNVASNGGFTYSVPIAVPPGSAGMAPSLSLEYSSHNPNGLQGLGWMLSGLPTIGRCPRTPVQDGTRGSVNFDANDRFCMDGQRLVLVTQGGTYGAPDTKYRTEVDGLSEIVAKGTAGTGPAWFEVKTKSGQIIEFGNSPNSAIPVIDATSGAATGTVRIWAASKISDTLGNYMTIVWDWTLQGEAYPTEVNYTGNAAAGVSPYNSVKFVYTTGRPDPIVSYQAGAVIRTTQLLDKIRTYANGVLVTEYRLGYASAGNQWDKRRLNTIQQCDGTGGGAACLPATTFDWQGSHGQPTMTTVTPNPAINPSYGGAPGDLTPADFNGDGVTDLSAADPHFTDDPPPCQPIFFGRPNPSSQTSIFVDGGMTTDYTLWWFVSEPPQHYENRQQTTPCFGEMAFNRLFVDLEGDGYTDVLLLQNTSDVNRQFFTLRNNRQGRLAQTSTISAFLVGGATDVGDFNGDGKTDLFGRIGSWQDGKSLYRQTPTDGLCKK